MQFVVLAGGRGARLGRLSDTMPKSLLPVAGKPMMHRIIDHATGFDIREFVLALGYRASDVAAYFDQLNDCDHRAVSQDQPHRDPGKARSTRVLSVDTGLDATKTERLLALRPYLKDQTFILSYCDGLSDIDLDEMLRFHHAHGGVMTIAAVHGRERFGILDLDGDRIDGLQEKPVDYSRWINGGLFILEPSVFDHIDPQQSDWETGAVQTLIAEGKAFAYRHHGWWECIDRPEDIPQVEETLEAMRRDTAGLAAQ
jgi:glucose-1-phosphate cytidylyltransferase